jgi:signal transduction histidine kinase
VGGAVQVRIAALLAALRGQFAVIDDAGIVTEANTAWIHDDDHRPASLPGGVTVGESFLAACRGSHGPMAAQLVAGTESVLRGVAERFSMDFDASNRDTARWFEVVVAQLDRPGSGAIIFNRDITGRVTAEREAQAQRTIVAHIARVATVGELATSLAHEINQPLAAIVTNAQTALRLTVANPLPLTDLTEILADVVRDGRRAGEVIRRVQALVRRGDVVRQSVDLNDLLHEVGRWVASEALIRQTALHWDLDGALPSVVGDRVQLEQVLLNLVLNALDATAEAPGSSGQVVVRTTSTNHEVIVAVRDWGRGIAADALPRIFEPFFTTKREGLGVGLAIARSIAEMHGGRIEATNEPECGATFSFYLPRPTDPAASRAQDQSLQNANGETSLATSNAPMEHAHERRDSRGAATRKF